MFGGPRLFIFFPFFGFGVLLVSCSECVSSAFSTSSSPLSFFIGIFKRAKPPEGLKFGQTSRCSWLWVYWWSRSWDSGSSSKFPGRTGKPSRVSWGFRTGSFRSWFLGRFYKTSSDKTVLLVAERRRSRGCVWSLRFSSGSLRLYWRRC